MTEDAKLIDSAEIEELQNRIEALESDDAMDAGVLDGYITACALNPAAPSEEDVIPFIFSASGDPEALPDDERLLELIRMRMREIRAALNAGGGLDPVIFPLADDEGNEILDEEGIEAIVPWAAGFMMGTEQWPDAVIESEDVRSAVIPIAARMASSPDELEDEAARAVYAAAVEACPKAKDLAEALYQVVESVFTLKKLLVPNRPVRNAEPRVGRNDPCPCGSGKKYKQCCGKKA
ncbi:UPF0149 family protein [Sutterella sp.]|uniref:UPF0149 family protein n=1 Tax=Sutterella sp. TaxID=1981025 RepID=UPI0026DF7A9E|nr:UPF0149 family protein [Sutterella sp.]MDO5532406.1 UPF0149 family protein [Sutterella sp.]